MTPFRFGVNALRAASRAEWLDNARKVEDLGYAVLGVPDHLSERLAPLPALVSAASVTTTLRVATTVLKTTSAIPCCWLGRPPPSISSPTAVSSWAWARAT
jgi:alkanesulfonate monooxygenase SsuD/methylene tetrahydromethanopterin reductase-like flavin-dependent oxidoreductase (luciferase family)